MLSTALRPMRDRHQVPEHVYVDDAPAVGFMCVAPSAPLDGICLLDADNAEAPSMRCGTEVDTALDDCLESAARAGRV